MSDMFGIDTLERLLCRPFRAIIMTIGQDAQGCTLSWSAAPRWGLPLNLIR